MINLFLRLARKVRTPWLVAALAVVFLLIGAVYYFGVGYLQSKGEQLAGSEPLGAPSISVESTGQQSPNIVGNSGDVDVRIQVPRDVEGEPDETP